MERMGEDVSKYVRETAMNSARVSRVIEFLSENARPSYRQRT